MLFNHCKHQRWRIWWRENWLPLCVFDQTGLWCLLLPSPSAWALYVTPPQPQALGSAHGVYFLAYSSIPWGDTAPGVMPFPITLPWTLTGHVATHSLRDSFPPEQAWKLTLCFGKTPHPWVSPCSAGKTLELRNLRMAGGNSWKMCQHCAAEQGGPNYLWMRQQGDSRKLSATGWSSVQAAKHF